jgi:hypothetical protein
MAALITAGGATEALVKRRSARLCPAAALAAVGGMFLNHEQHGSAEARAVAERVHRRLGLSLIAAGAAKAADGLNVPGPWQATWPALSLLVAGQLLRYREPEGAYQ